MDSDNEIVQRGKEVDEDANILEDICSEPESDFVQRIHGEDGQLVHKEVRFFCLLYCEARDFFFGIEANES